MSQHRMSASRVVHKSMGGTLQSLPEPVDPVGNPADYLTPKTVAPPTFAAPRQMGHCCRIFTPAQPVYPAASVRDFLSGALMCVDNFHGSAP